MTMTMTMKATELAPRRRATDLSPLCTRPASACTEERERLLAARGSLVQAHLLVEQLQRALESRIAVEQAKGWLAASAEVGTDAAFDALRRYSRDNNLKLQQVAREVVAGTLAGQEDLLRRARGG